MVGVSPVAVTGKTRESNSVTSLQLESADGQPLSAGLPGQFVVLRLRPASDSPPLLRRYSLSGEQSETRYRISVKRNARGAAAAYIDDKVRVDDIIKMMAPRGAFMLQSGAESVVLLSAGVASRAGGCRAIAFTLKC